MHMAEDIDRHEDFERAESRNNLPLGWVLLFAGLLLWGIYYAVSYTPQISGWTQEGQYRDSLQQR
jgi:hypothetical protein